jgi:glycosyltransferase involved in cell wall biosynthesis
MPRVPRVSVVMPARDAAGTLSAAIQSIVDQSMPDWELIIVNDGSTDATESVILQFASVDRRIRSLNSGGVGEPGARNAGLADAGGRWVAMMDADDMAMPSRLGRQLSFLDRNPDLFGVASRAVLFVERARPLGLSAVDAPTTTEELAAMMRRGILFTYCHPTLMLKREDLRAIGGYDESFFQACDAELVNRALYQHHLPILVMNEPLIWQRLSPQGMSTKGLSLQRRVARYLRDRNQAWLRNEDPLTLDEFLSKRVSPGTRLRWMRHDLAAGLYRRTGILLGKGHRIWALLLLAPAALLHPRYVFAKMRRQRLGGRDLTGLGISLPPTDWRNKPQ